MHPSRLSPIILASLPLLASCSSHKAKPAPPPPQVGVVTVSSRPVTMTAELTGRTASALASDVRPQVDGLIEKRLFVEGSPVRAGQPLYQIDARSYRAAVDQAAATLESARATEAAAQAQAARYRSLTDAEAVSRQQIDTTVAAARQSRAAVHQAAAALRAARINLSYTTIRAPISGRIGRSAVTPGALVTASQAAPLATIQRLDPIYVDVTQSSDALMALRRSLRTGAVAPSGTAVRLATQDGSTYPEAGRLEFAEVTVDPNTGTVALRATFPNPQGMLLPGMFVRLSTPQGVLPNGILVPQQGVTRDPKGNATALVVGAGNKVVQRSIVTRQAVGSLWLVSSGLRSGERLIVEGTAAAAPGQVVRPMPARVGKAG